MASPGRPGRDVRIARTVPAARYRPPSTERGPGPGGRRSSLPLVLLRPPRSSERAREARSPNLFFGIRSGKRDCSQGFGPGGQSRHKSASPEPACPWTAAGLLPHAHRAPATLTRQRVYITLHGKGHR